MHDTYLEITFRKGKPLAAYLYLSGRRELKASRSRPIAPGLVVDYGSQDQPIGLEITAPAHTPVARINQVLQQLHFAQLSDRELAPLSAA
jgi:hypothetical protein